MEDGICYHVLLRNGIGLRLGAVIRIRGIGIDGRLVFYARFQKIQFHRDLTGILVGNTTHIPHIVRCGVPKVFYRGIVG